MDGRKTDLPMGIWHGMDKFDHGAWYAEVWFLVWIVPPAGADMEAAFDLCWMEGDRFMGAWRHQCHADGSPHPEMNEVEPVAFMIVGSPDLSKLVSQAA